jgi:glucose-6-phosphate dehydrogenase-like protein
MASARLRARPSSSSASGRSTATGTPSRTLSYSDADEEAPALVASAHGQVHGRGSAPADDHLPRSTAAHVRGARNLVPTSVFDLGDRGGIDASFLAKVPGSTMRLGKARMRVDYDPSFADAHELEAYERLIHDALLGDPTLFTRGAASSACVRSPPPFWRRRRRCASTSAARGARVAHAGPRDQGTERVRSLRTFVTNRASPVGAVDAARGGGRSKRTHASLSEPTPCRGPRRCGENPCESPSSSGAREGRRLPSFVTNRASRGAAVDGLRGGCARKCMAYMHKSAHPCGDLRRCCETRADARP